jgi:hypothetical protein
MPKTKKQKIYKMKGCSKKCNKSKSRKYLGGNNLNLAYTGKPIFSVPNPHLAYTGNINGKNPVYPNTGPPPASQDWLNSSTQRGGGCGGTCPLHQNGGKKHHHSKKCAHYKKQKGGNGLPYGQGLSLIKAAPYPNGLTGQTWEPNFKWPGTNSIGGDYNHYSNNTYNNDVPNQIISAGAQPPFSVGGGRKMRKHKYKNRNKTQKGGVISNFLYQDLVNVGRQAQFGLGSTYNALRGYSSPVNPMPWQGQLANKH